MLMLSDTCRRRNMNSVNRPYARKTRYHAVHAAPKPRSVGEGKPPNTAYASQPRFWSIWAIALTRTRPCLPQTPDVRYSHRHKVNTEDAVVVLLSFLDFSCCRCKASIVWLPAGKWLDSNVSGSYIVRLSQEQSIVYSLSQEQVHSISISAFKRSILSPHINIWWDCLILLLFVFIFFSYFCFCFFFLYLYVQYFKYLLVLQHFA